jgi:hypothetical protein
MSEEAEALLHSSKSTNKALKSILTLMLILIVSLVERGVVSAVVDGFEDRKFWVGILMDSVSFHSSSLDSIRSCLSKLFKFLQVCPAYL